MPRKYAVLKQFTIDLNRLLREAEAGYAVLRDAQVGGKTPTQAQILAVYRPVHSLKGSPHLADVVPSVLAAMGVAGFTGPIQLPEPVRGACVLLVDGLGAGDQTPGGGRA